MAFDDMLNEKRRQQIQDQLMQRQMAAEEKSLFEKAIDARDQFSRNIEAGAYTDNAVGDVTPESLTLMKLKESGLPDTANNREAVNIGFEPAVMGGIGVIGKDPKAVLHIAQNLRNTAKLMGSASKPNQGYGAIKVIDTEVKPWIVQQAKGLMGKKP